MIALLLPIFLAVCPIAAIPGRMKSPSNRNAMEETPRKALLLWSSCASLMTKPAGVVPTKRGGGGGGGRRVSTTLDAREAFMATHIPDPVRNEIEFSVETTPKSPNRCRFDVVSMSRYLLGWPRWRVILSMTVPGRCLCWSGGRPRTSCRRPGRPAAAAARASAGQSRTLGHKSRDPRRTAPPSAGRRSCRPLRTKRTGAEKGTRISQG